MKDALFLIGVFAACACGAFFGVWLALGMCS